MQQLLIDTREKDNKRIDKAIEILEEDYNITVSQLDVGDYVFNNTVAFEYKTVEDFISSIKDNRVFNQAISMSEEFDYHFVMIVGNPTKTLKEQEYGEPISIEQYRGAICRLNTITTVIETRNNTEAFERMKVQTKKCIDSKPLLKHYNLPKTNPSMQYLVGLKGISDKTALLISNECKLYYLDDLLSLTAKDLTAIKGIGKKTAYNILTQIRSDIRKPQRRTK